MKFLILLLVLFILTGEGACSDHLNKRQIEKLVQQNREFLTECIDENQPERATRIRGVQSVRVENAEETYIEFYCGGAGLVPDSSYYGFYYSPEDVPLAVDVTGTDDLKEEGEGFIYLQEDGDNMYYTERIMECWYYYESHY